LSSLRPAPPCRIGAASLLRSCWPTCFPCPSNPSLPLQRSQRWFWEVFDILEARAKERLFITNAKRRRHYGQFRDCEPSRFVLDINKDRLEIDKKSVEQRVDWTSKRRPRFNFPQNSYDPDAVHFNNETTPGFGELDQTRTIEHTYEQSGWDEFSQLPAEPWEQPSGVQNMRDRAPRRAPRAI